MLGEASPLKLIWVAIRVRGRGGGGHCKYRKYFIDWAAQDTMPISPPSPSPTPTEWVLQGWVVGKNIFGQEATARPPPPPPPEKVVPVCLDVSSEILGCGYVETLYILGRGSFCSSKLQRKFCIFMPGPNLYDLPHTQGRLVAHRLKERIVFCSVQYHFDVSVILMLYIKAQIKSDLVS